MKNEKQIVLFLKRKTEFNQTQLAAKLNEKFPELKEPVTLPLNANDPNQPLIIFNQGELNLTINYNDVSFIFFEENKSSVEDFIIEIVDFLENYDLDFVRMGYISTFLNGKEQQENFKQKIFKSDDLIKDDFQLSWYKKELIDSVKVNVWERHFTDLSQNIDLISIYDINTPLEEEYNISSDFMKSFLKKCDKYIENKNKERL